MSRAHKKKSKHTFVFVEENGSDGNIQSYLLMSLQEHNDTTVTVSTAWSVSTTSVLPQTGRLSVVFPHVGDRYTAGNCGFANVRSVQLY